MISVELNAVRLTFNALFLLQPPERWSPCVAVIFTSELHRCMTHDLFRVCLCLVVHFPFSHMLCLSRKLYSKDTLSPSCVWLVPRFSSDATVLEAYSNIFIRIFHLVCVMVGAVACLWRSEDTFVELVLFSFCGSWGLDSHQACLAKHFDLLSCPCPALESSVCSLLGYSLLLWVLKFLSFFIRAVFPCGVSLQMQHWLS